MTWTQLSRYCIRSQNGYQVARIHARDRVTWEAWAPGYDPASANANQRASGEPLKECIGIFESGQEARDACEKHANS